MRTTISIMTALALLSAVKAEEPKRNEIPEAQKLMERARQAKEAGRFDEAHELAEQAKKIGSAHRDGRPGINGGAPERLEKVRHEIEELHRAGKHEEAEQLKRRVAEAMEHKRAPEPKRASAPKEGDGPARLRHVAEAIHHLREAGLNEQAEGLEKIARGMHEQLEHREKEERSRNDGKPRPPANELRAMQEQIAKLAHAVEELRAQIKGRGEEEVRKPRG